MEEITLIGSSAYSLFSIEASTMPERNLLADLIEERGVIPIELNEYEEVLSKCKALRRI